MIYRLMEKQGAFFDYRCERNDKNMKIAKALVAILLVCSLFAGCASENGEKASVQAVSMICGAGNVGMQNRYAGMVSARGEVNIEKDENR